MFAHRPMLCEGVVRAAPHMMGDGVRVPIDLRGCVQRDAMIACSGHVELTSDALLEPVHRGDRVRFRATLRPPTQYFNPGSERLGWRRQVAGVVAVGYLTESAWMRVIASAPSLHRWLEGWRAQTVASIQRDMATPSVRGVVRAMILGEAGALESAQWEAFRRVGVIHLLVVSGLHVGIIAMLLWGLFWWAVCRIPWLTARYATPRCVAVLTLIGVWGYTVVVGARLPTVRAALLISVWLLAQLLGRRRDLVSALALAMLVLLCWQPLALWSPSFQLTCAAVAAILLWGAWLMQLPLAPTVGLGRWGWGVVAMTIAATIGVAPILLTHFHQVSLLGLVSNLLCVPWTTFFIVPLGLLYMVVAPWWADGAAFVAVPLQGAVEILITIVRWFDGVSAPWQWRFVPGMCDVAAWYALWLVPVLQWPIGTQRRRGRRRVAWLVLVVGIGSLTLSLGGRGVAAMSSSTLRYWQLDVGQGSAAVLRLPNGRTYLIDGGGIPKSRFDMGRWVVVPTLQRLGIDRIDALVMTHYHPDHFGGLAAVAETYHPEVLYTNGSAYDDADRDEASALGRLAATALPTIALSSATPPWTDGDVTFRVLHPSPDDRDLSENDRSVVVEISYREVRLLLTGDIEKAAEEALVARGDLQTVDVMMVPHHGSDSSSTDHFVAVVKPTYVMISSGRHNRYGFPRRSTLEIYARYEAHIYRTDQDGMIAVETDGTNIEIDTFFE